MGGTFSIRGEGRREHNNKVDLGRKVYTDQNLAITFKKMSHLMVTSTFI